ncbi:MAG TPA: hypothetical protein VKQ31_09335, partial [Steroidobacteraceae bacterium]|nr:hypothetical protein [Steroidobacteraceae bacterium]
MSLDGLGRHAPHPFFGVQEDVLTIGGRPVPELAAEHGHTPFYAYAREYLDARVAQLRVALPREIHLHYAIKANPMPAVVRHMASLVDGLDVASARELEIALATGTEPQSISFAGPGKTEAELALAAAAGIIINIESERELRVLTAMGREGQRRPRVAVRVNPDFELKTSGMKMGGGPKPFGVDAEIVPQLLARMSALPLEFVGFHIFSGSQNLSADAIVDAQRKSVALAVRLAAAAPGPVKVLNIGGGFGIPYFPGERPLDLDPIGTNLRELAGGLRETLPEARLVIELGRYLVGEAGLYVCRVVDRKVSRGQVFLVTDGGLH